jgi:hypothetical protein
MTAETSRKALANEQNYAEPSWFPPAPIDHAQTGGYSESELQDFAQYYRSHAQVESRDFSAPRYIHGEAMGYGVTTGAKQRRRAAPTGKVNVRSNAQREPRSVGRMAGLAALAMFAIITGSGMGYLSAKPELLSYAGIVERANTLIDGTQKKPAIASASSVKSIFGIPDSPIALNITSQSSDGTLAYRFTGLPDDAYLTAGVKIAEGKWEVKAQDLPNIGLVVPGVSVADIDLQVSAIEPQSGEVAFPAQQIKVAIGDVRELPLPQSPMEQNGEASVTAKTTPEIAPLQAAGDPGVAGDEKVNAETIQPANSRPETTIIAEPEKAPLDKKPKKTLKKLLLGE